MRRIAIMQPYVFPYIGYYQLISAVDRFVCYDDVAFIKQGWIARNRILLNGVSHTFSIPLRDVSSFRLISETELHDTKYPIWRSKFLKTLKMGYASAPYFEPVFNLANDVLHAESRSISKLAFKSLQQVMQYLDIKTDMVETSVGYSNNLLKAQERVLDICRQEHAAVYINVPGGEALYSRDAFVAQGIQLKFIRPQLRSYKQTSGKEFVPGLSILDVLMNNSVKDCQSMLTNFDLN